MDFGIDLFYSAKHLDVVIVRQSVVQAADYVHLRDVLTFHFDGFEDVFQFHHVRTVLSLFSVKGTELAIESANIGIIEHVVFHKVRVRAVDFLAYHVGEISQHKKVVRIIESYPIFPAESLPSFYFTVNIVEITEAIFKDR